MKIIINKLIFLKKMEVFRHKFCKTFQEQIEDFSRQHKYDDYITLKEKFKEWLQSNQSCIMEEERRICYVGITRAKERLYLSNCSQRFTWNNSGKKFYDAIS